MTVENHIPIPPKTGRGGPNSMRRRFLEALLKLNPGQSTSDLCATERNRGVVLEVARANGLSVTTRKLDKGGWRIWRIK